MIKKLSEKKRVNLSIFIKKLFYSFGLANNKEIDEVNILNITILSMKRALEKFNGYTNTVKIDKSKIFNYNEKTFLIKGVILNLYQLPLHQFWQNF